MFSFVGPALELIKKIFPFIICGVIFYLLHLWQSEKKDRENAETIAGFKESNFAISKELLKQQLEDHWNDSILNANGYKPKNVQAVTNIHYHKTEVVNKDSVVTIKDSSVCVNYDHKGFKLSGCDGTYVDERDFSATGFVINQPTKKFLFIKYRKRPTLKAWTSYGDTLQVNIIQKK